MSEAIISPEQKKEEFYVPRFATVFDINDVQQQLSPQYVLGLLMGSPPRGCYTKEEAEQIIRGWVDEIKRHYDIRFLVPDKMLGTPITQWKDINQKIVCWSCVNSIEVWSIPEKANGAIH